MSAILLASEEVDLATCFEAGCLVVAGFAFGAVGCCADTTKDDAIKAHARTGSLISFSRMSVGKNQQWFDSCA